MPANLLRLSSRCSSSKALKPPAALPLCKHVLDARSKLDMLFSLSIATKGPGVLRRAAGMAAEDG